MDPNARIGLLTLAAFFCVIFLLLTLAALATATPSLGSVVTFGLSFMVIALILIGVIGAIRNPPDE